MGKDKMMKTLADHMNSTIKQMVSMQAKGMEMQNDNPMEAMIQMMVE